MIDIDLLKKLYPTAPSTYPTDLQQYPTPHVPVVTQRDADNKFLFRYFVRAANDTNYIVEVNESEYKKFQRNPRFIVTQIKWKVIGERETVTLSSGAQVYGVADVNRQVVANADLTFKGLRNYITDYTYLWLSE